MKRILFIFFATIFSLVVNASDVEINGVYYNLVAKANAAEVTYGSPNYVGDINIPETIVVNGITYTVKAISSSAFGTCKELTSVTLPNSVEEIGSMAFDGCTKLSSITIGTGLKKIDDWAFYQCSSLKSISFPDGLETIGTRAFAYCSSLSSVSLPYSIKTLGENAFAYCSNLISASLPDAIMTVPPYVFYKCTSLKSVKISKYSFFIGKYAFYGCSSLISVELPSFIIMIGEKAFQDCTSLQSVVIPDGVTDLFSYSFANCPNLKDVYCLSEKVPSASSSTFYNSKINYATLHVLSKSLNDYKYASVWNNFGKIVALSDDEIQTLDIDEVENTNDPSFKIMVNKGNIWIDGLKRGTKIYVYRVSGQMIYSTEAKSNSLSIDLSQKKGEMMILKIGNQTKKIVIN